jgi:hypothetical protein
MSEIRKWLDSIGLGQYGDAYEDGPVARKLGGRVPKQLQHAPHLDIGIVRAEQRSKNCKTFNPVLASPGILLSNFKWLGD